ncbi:hypothetical protein KP509_09G088700 [Ceratopteris richardii]|uniref:Pre-mRNA processing factor 4 (PRP4)-like domain-containing protein n=1 Tax=Ceratopteris richardii TaxID=49495 RepID=A0A8T2U8W5_CERRI|nr:hypothetical protein KP509_09G088700 [Ceratopteris richardii]
MDDLQQRPMYTTPPLAPLPTIPTHPPGIVTTPAPGSTPFPATSLPPLHPPGVTVADDSFMAEADGAQDTTAPAPKSPVRNVLVRRANEEPAAEYEASEESRKAKERQEQAIQQIMLNRRAKALAVPTNDAIVRSRLRSLDQPITLFGEREMERRERLRALMAQLDANGELDRFLASTHAFGAALAEDIAAKEEERMEEVQTAPFFTEGPPALLQTRIDIMKYSLSRAASRIMRMKQKRENPDEDEDAELDYVLERMSNISMNCSQIGDDRPLSSCAFSPDGDILATSGWSGVTKLWAVDTMERTITLRGHTERVTSVVFSPTNKNLATASADRTAILWGLDGSCLKKFEGHLDRLARLAFHPSGAYLGTASFDKTWRLWDVNTGIELLLQEGHSRSVYGIAFQCDGSLVATGGLDALARVWDLRTGRSILALEGHVKPVSLYW